MTQPVHISNISLAAAVTLTALDSVIARLRPRLERPIAVVRGNAQLLIMLVLRLVHSRGERRRYVQNNLWRRDPRTQEEGWAPRHQYHRGETPIACTWDSIRLCINTENLGSRHFLGGYTLADGRA